MDWEKIFDHLTSNGYDVYSLGQHKGDCTTPYLVLRNNGSTTYYSMAAQEYEVLLYYPVDRYSGFEGYISGVKACMNKLYPAVTLTEDQQPHNLDDDVKAYMTGLIYLAPRRNEVNHI